jgi:hypothetical protein
MIEQQVWFIAAKEQPSHIHVPRPSRIRRPDEEGTAGHRHVACLQEQIGADRDPQHKNWCSLP